jgi:hypothetical protein
LQFLKTIKKRSCHSLKQKKKPYMYSTLARLFSVCLQNPHASVQVLGGIVGTVCLIQVGASVHTVYDAVSVSVSTGVPFLEALHSVYELRLEEPALLDCFSAGLKESFKTLRAGRRMTEMLTAQGWEAIAASKANTAALSHSSSVHSLTATIKQGGARQAFALTNTFALGPHNVLGGVQPQDLGRLGGVLPPFRLK